MASTPTEFIGNIVPSVQSFGLGTVDIIAYVIITVVIAALMTVGIIRVMNLNSRKLLTAANLFYIYILLIVFLD